MDGPEIDIDKLPDRIKVYMQSVKPEHLERAYIMTLLDRHQYLASLYKQMASKCIKAKDDMDRVKYADRACYLSDELRKCGYELMAISTASKHV